MKATIKRSVGLYRGLTNKQKAAVFIELAAEQNTDECERLLSQVERRAYTAPHIEYDAWSTSLFNTCLLVAADYWRLAFLHSQSLVVLVENAKVEDEALESARLALGKRLALQAAFKEICQQHGVNYESACKLAGITPEPETDLVELVDKDYYQRWIDDLSDILPKV